jgi:molybdopterin synthase catalytic subunit
MTHLTREPIQVERLIARVGGPGRGGIATFLGVVRDHQDGRKVTGLEYSAYEPMADAECARIVAEATGRWPVVVALEHRLGPLEVGEIAVGIAAGADHRAAAFEACRYVIEEVKRRVPIWKRENYADGTIGWVDPTRPGATRDPNTEVPVRHG